MVCTSIVYVCAASYGFCFFNIYFAIYIHCCLLVSTEIQSRENFAVRSKKGEKSQRQES